MCDYPRIIYMNKIKIFAHFMYICMYVCMTAPSYAEPFRTGQKDCLQDPAKLECYYCGYSLDAYGQCDPSSASCTNGVIEVQSGTRGDWRCSTVDKSWCLLKEICDARTIYALVDEDGGLQQEYITTGCDCDMPDKERPTDNNNWKCANGYYAAGIRNCVRCPEHSTSIDPGKSGIDSCKCDANYYMDNGMCVACPDGATSDVGAVGASACKCPVGTYMYANRCQDCPALIENPGADWGPMPDATTSGIGAENITDCYIPASSQYEDNTGYFTYDADCSYKISP